MSDDLKPCPFCGGPVQLERAADTRSEIFGVRKWWGVVCRNTINLGGTCAVQTIPSASEEAAIKRWNTRRPTPEQSGEARDAARYQTCEDLCMYFTDTMGDRIGISLPIPDHPPMKSTAEVFRWIIDAAMDRSALGREG